MSLPLLRVIIPICGILKLGIHTMMKIRCRGNATLSVEFEGDIFTLLPGKTYSFSSDMGRYLLGKYPETLSAATSRKDQMGAQSRMLSRDESETK